MKQKKLIEVKNLNKTFENGEQVTNALRDVNLSISDGELIAIEGSSGSGKSTLLSLLGLLDAPSSGAVYIREQNTSDLTNKQKSIIRNQHIGWIFQNFSLISNLSSLENVSIPLRFNPNISSKEYFPLSKSALEKVNLKNKLNSKPSQLSGGQQQRVAIARAIACNPSLILADEPTGNLDSTTSDQIIKLLLSMSDTGATVIIVTHDEKVANRCRRRIKINDGRVVDDSQ